mmetsp:Transcript_16646/g.46077  ORF Transcript_16646/g.46077 Transcript_16646/m.46077 type:complete len:215 (+) Transcript_16646:477-1121(+)
MPRSRKPRPGPLARRALPHAASLQALGAEAPLPLAAESVLGLCRLAGLARTTARTNPQSRHRHPAAWRTGPSRLALQGKVQTVAPRPQTSAAHAPHPTTPRTRRPGLARRQRPQAWGRVPRRRRGWRRRPRGRPRGGRRRPCRPCLFPSRPSLLPLQLRPRPPTPGPAIAASSAAPPRVPTAPGPDATCRPRPRRPPRCRSGPARGSGPRRRAP